MDYTITDEMIAAAEEANACEWSIEWLRKQPRTWRELVEYRPSWAAWAMVNVTSIPADLSGIKSEDERAWVMARRPDCQIDLTGLDHGNRAWVRSHRFDCPKD